MTPRRFLAEPLVHFLAAGAMIFVLVSVLGPHGSDNRTIHLTRDDLLTYMQGRARIYDAKTFTRLLAAMPGKKRRKLIHDAALQEALYREGRAISLAQADPLIRQRIVQQMRLLIMEEAAAGVTVSEPEIAQYYNHHAKDYRVPPTVTFTHVFFSTAVHGASAKRLAGAELAKLRADRVPFEQASRHGDRFLYQTNYIDSDRPLVARHFGKEMARRLFAAQAATGWQGPFQSDYGWHLILLRERTEGALPPLEKIRDIVREDALGAKRRLLADRALDQMLTHYRIELGPGIEQ